MERPSAARVYDFYLGGFHNFAADREMGRRAVELWPELPEIMQANRAFMRRAIRYATSEGITQFLDIGSGIPTFGNVHEDAQALNSRARVVYADNDPVAVAHSRAVLRGDDRAGIVSADFRSPQDILHSPELGRVLDLDRPVALMLVALLHLIEDKDDPWKAVRELADALAPGSLLVLSHASTDNGPRRDSTALQQVYRSASAPLVMRSRRHVQQFFEDFELLDPGLVSLPLWRPDGPPDQEDPVVFSGFAGVGRKTDPGRTG